MKAVVLVLVLAALGSGLLASCATRPRAPETTQTFVLERDLVGAISARGEFRTITGVKRKFDAALNGSWDGETLTLVEDFVFEDGEKDRKTWVLKQVGPGEWSGTREDVVGQARGFQDGAVFRLEYDVILPSKNGNGMKVRFRDVLAATPTGDVLNTATVGWFGLHVGAVDLVMTR
jgi:hypothetical protein